MEEEMSSLWSYQETIDELKQKLLYTTLDLESVKAQTNSEKSKNKQYTMQLLQLVKTVSKERDEAKDQVQKLLSQIMPSNLTKLIKSTKANLSITEGNSFSDTITHHSRATSPADSFLNAVSSPDLSNLTQPFSQDYHDEGSLVIDKFAEGKSLPKKGKLLQAVLEAGPLLQTLMTAGPLPQWRNPPPHQPIEVPPFCVNKGPEMSFLPKLLDSSFVEMNCGSLQMMSTSSLVNFGGGAIGSCISTGNLIAAGTIISNYGFSGKRQKLQKL